MKNAKFSVLFWFFCLVISLGTSTVTAATVDYVWTEKNGGTSTGTLTLSAAGILAPPSSWGPLASVTVDSLIFNGTDYTASVTAASGIASDGSGLTGGNITFAPSSIAFVLAAETDQVTIVNAGATNYMGDWKVATVPVPAAVWLFGSGLLGLIGMARRKRV